MKQHPIKECKEHTQNKLHVNKYEGDNRKQVIIIENWLGDNQWTNSIIHIYIIYTKIMLCDN